MRIAIEHVTKYAYAEEAGYSVQILRLTPQTFDGHSVLDWRVAIEPDGHMTTSRDGFGNVIQLATVTRPHREIVIRAQGTVEVEDRSGVVLGLAEAVPTRVFLRRTGLTDANAAIRELVEARADSNSIARLHAIMDSIRDRVEYKIGATKAETTAAEALANGVGVCQDHAHIFIAAARIAGIPARYVTGYLLQDEDDASEAHHAWAEAWVDGLGWVGFDVANRMCPTDRYVRLASGLDAHFAAPVRGSRRGAGTELLTVAVTVRPEGAPSSQSQSQSQSSAPAPAEMAAQSQSKGAGSATAETQTKSQADELKPAAQSQRQQ